MKRCSYCEETMLNEYVSVCCECFSFMKKQRDEAKEEIQQLKDLALGLIHELEIMEKYDLQEQYREDLNTIIKGGSK